MTEKTNEKKKWEKPELKVLVRNLPEENVLGCCKSTPSSCQNESVAASIQCS